MSRKRSPVNDLKNVLETIGKAEMFVEGIEYEDFLEDEKTIFAVSKAIELVGETLKHVPEEIKAQYPDVPWEDIYGMRNFLAHNYFSSDVDEIWKTVKDDIPELKPILQDILQKESEKLQEENKNEPPRVEESEESLAGHIIAP